MRGKWWKKPVIRGLKVFGRMCDGGKARRDIAVFFYLSLSFLSFVCYSFSTSSCFIFFFLLFFSFSLLIDLAFKFHFILFTSYFFFFTSFPSLLIAFSFSSFAFLSSQWKKNI